MEVIYTGLHQTVPSIVKQAIQEDVDIIGLSIMSGAHIPICRKLMTLLAEERIKDNDRRRRRCHPQPRRSDPEGDGRRRGFSGRQPV